MGKGARFIWGLLCSPTGLRKADCLVQEGLGAGRSRTQAWRVPAEITSCAAGSETASWHGLQPAAAS